MAKELDEQGMKIEPENAGGRRLDPTLGGFQHVRPQEPRKYTVKKGDTLRSISMNLYGTQDRWEEIYQANKPVIPDPENLGVTLELKVPE